MYFYYLFLETADQLHKKVDSEPSPEPKAVNVPISFDSSWKTRGFYSNIGFGAAISTSSKKVLDYEILSRLCEKCSIWTEEKQKDKPSEYEKWLERHKPNCRTETTRDLPTQVNRCTSFISPGSIKQ